MDQDGNARFKTSQNEYIKTYIVVDGANNPIEIYEAAMGCPNGGPCIKTTYEYYFGTSIVQKTKEEDFLWDSTWDI